MTTATGLEKVGRTKRETTLPYKSEPLQRAPSPAELEGEQRGPMQTREAGLPGAWLEVPRPAGSGDANARLLTQKECGPACVTHAPAPGLTTGQHSCPGTPELQLRQEPGLREKRAALQRCGGR